VLLSPVFVFNNTMLYILQMDIRAADSSSARKLASKIHTYARLRDSSGEKQLTRARDTRHCRDIVAAVLRTVHHAVSRGLSCICSMTDNWSPRNWKVRILDTPTHAWTHDWNIIEGIGGIKAYLGPFSGN